MLFFSNAGVCLEPGKKYSQIVDKSIHVSMAAIDPSAKGLSIGLFIRSCYLFSNIYYIYIFMNRITNYLKMISYIKYNFKTVTTHNLYLHSIHSSFLFIQLLHTLHVCTPLPSSNQPPPSIHLYPFSLLSSILYPFPTFPLCNPKSVSFFLLLLCLSTISHPPSSIFPFPHNSLSKQHTPSTQPTTLTGSKEHTSLWFESGSSSYLLCSLGHHTYQEHLDLNFNEAEAVTLYSKGTGIVRCSLNPLLAFCT